MIMASFNGPELQKIMGEHGPNVPRTHDATGARISPPEPVQCRKCLRSYPCQTHELASALFVNQGGLVA